MKFAEIIREAGVCQDLFPRCCEKDIVLYDEEGQKVEQETISFKPTLFEDNLDSFKKFMEFLENLEAKKIDSAFNIQITKDYVIVFHKTPNPKFFLRTEPADPLDFAD